ncbi:ArgE/DapE family deacylase [Bacillus timonensis]|uniref:ArgE/DapE family deacylase n=1 Tax=Bacillus timonensis TaxID=1033734 RepID=A0A4S3PNE6_9BACI|nr:ArgE/DapE family deacylase [Bacillus timonensis]THE11091.1 ArgE/DapE family deacylase [Bacillus timonensis]
MREIVAQVDLLKEEIVQTLQDMVRIPTINPPGEKYGVFKDYFENHLDKLGYETEILEVPEEKLSELAPLGCGLPRYNIVGRLSGTSKNGKCICLNGHYDVVPVGNGWTKDPFGGEVIDGKLYGRGASDMKSGLVTQIFAVEALRRSGLQWNGEIIQTAVPDEETVGNRNAGTGYLVEQGIISKDKVDTVIITEPFEPNGIGIGHKGAIWGEITVLGKQAHGSQPSRGINAVEMMAEFLHLVNVHLQPKLQQRTTDLNVTPDESIYSTLSFDTIKGGETTNIVPDKCNVTFNRRLLPVETIEGARAEIQAILNLMKEKDQRFRYEYREFYTTEHVLVPERIPVAEVAKEVITDLGMSPKFLITAGSDDQRFVVNNAGIENCIIYGPGKTSEAHQADEHIDIEDLILGTKALALMLYKMLA